MPVTTEIDVDNLTADFSKPSFLMQVSEASHSSGGTTAYSLETLSSPEFFSSQCSDIDAMASRVVDTSKIKEAIREAVAETNFCVTVADPLDPDIPLIAASEQFSNMTGYNQAEILGKNCRFLNNGCNTDPHDMMRLRSSCKTGAEFVAVLTNRRKSGEFFLNLLDLCGLTVAQNPTTGEELWFLVGIQADVTNITELDKIQDDRIAEMHRVACCIRTKLADELLALAVSGALNAKFALSSDPSENNWCLLPTPKWRWTEDQSPRGDRLMSSPVAWNERSSLVKDDTSGGCCVPCTAKTPSTHLRVTLLIIGGACLLGSLWRQAVRRR